MISTAHLKIQLESTLAWPTLNKVPHWKGRFLLIKHLLTAARINRFEPFSYGVARFPDPFPKAQQTESTCKLQTKVHLQVQTFSSAAENSKQSQDFYCLEFQKSTSPGLKLQIQTRLSKDSKQTTGMMTTNLCVFPGEGHHILPIWISRV